MRLSLALLAALTVTACSDAPPASSAPAELVDPVPTATLTGRVVVDGPVPPPETVRLDADPKCAAMTNGGSRPHEAVVVGDDNSLKNVFIYVKDGLPGRLYPVPNQPVVLDQEECRYVPRVLGIQVGQQLTVRNSDALLHNVRAEGIINEPFDVGTPVQGMEVNRTFATREVMVPVKCNVHAWMNAYIGVLEHPFFAVSDADGRFAIPRLPAGTYTLEIWHERFGTQTRQVTVAAGDSPELTFAYKTS